MFESVIDDKTTNLKTAKLAVGLFWECLVVMFECIFDFESFVLSFRFFQGYILLFHL